LSSNPFAPWRSAAARNCRPDRAHRNFDLAILGQDRLRARPVAGVAFAVPAGSPLVFIDETSVWTTITRLYGRAPQDERLVQKVLHGNWKTVTLVAA
jgi:hypothetical protein